MLYLSIQIGWNDLSMNVRLSLLDWPFHLDPCQAMSHGSKYRHASTDPESEPQPFIDPEIGQETFPEPVISPETKLC